MKQLVNTLPTSKSSTVKPNTLPAFIPFSLVLLLTLFLITGCSKQDAGLQSKNENPVTLTKAGINQDLGSGFADVSKETARQLQEVRKATAIYHDIKHAFDDGYADINVVVPNMGYHFMKSAIVNAVFEVDKPEILVYNKTAQGNFDLVAVEYAVPISLSPDSAPEGFIGSSDVWERNETFGLWLCHAWVWQFNPDGVFHDTNPLVEVH